VLPFAKRFDQVAFVVDDLDKAQEYWRRQFGIDRWSVWTDLALGQIEKTYYGDAAEFEFSCAYAYSGDVLVELCRHDGGRSVYDDWLNTRGPGLHHIGYRVDTWEAFGEAQDHFLREGIEFAMGALMPGTGRFAYFDTVTQIGVFTEIYCCPNVLDIFERMKRGEIVEMPKTE
jgi:catechol 2,3-dioxygenase-like lactoylglutathione lyase family enzyme